MAYRYHYMVGAKWWEVVPLGATLIRINTGRGFATFALPNDTVDVIVDLFSDTVTEVKDAA